MPSIKELFYYVQAAAHLNIPVQDELQNEAKHLQRQFDAAEQGIFLDPMYKASPFDKNSTQGKVYCETLENDLTNAKARLDIFYPESARASSPKQPSTKDIINHEPL